MTQVLLSWLSAEPAPYVAPSVRQDRGAREGTPS